MNPFPPFLHKTAYFQVVFLLENSQCRLKKTRANKIFLSKIYISKTNNLQKYFACSKLRSIFPTRKKGEKVFIINSYNNKLMKKLFFAFEMRIKKYFVL